MIGLIVQRESPALANDDTAMTGMAGIAVFGCGSPAFFKAVL
jgi:hypothetical protein